MSVTLGQRSLDDLGKPLDDVTFCVVDVETTGGSAASGALTEIGAVKLHRGRCLATFHTLVNPGQPIPREITVLTGISDSTVADAPPARAAVTAFRDFLGSAVVVGHNVRYDIGYLDAEAKRCGIGPMPNQRVDTLALARRLIRDEVPNCKLSTLAWVLRLDHQPSHRALDDALATGDLLHLLIERASSWGVLGLDDLLALPKITGHPQAAKLRLTEGLPRLPGVYLFKDRSGRVLYVGKATNLRARVRSYFSGDDRRKVTSLLRETDFIDHIVCHHSLEAAVREIRLIHEFEPRFNRHGTNWRSAAYLRLTNEPFPRLSTVRKVPEDHAVFLGPLRSSAAAHRVADAIESVVPLRRCSQRAPATISDARLELGGQDISLRSPCAPAQLGVASCPCSGQITASEYSDLVDAVRSGFDDDPEALIGPLRTKLSLQACEARFEEATATRDRAGALAQALIRQRRLDMWRGAERVVLSMPDGSGAEIRHGLMHAAWGPGAAPSPDALAATKPPHKPVPREIVDEVMCIAGVFERWASQIRIEHVDGTIASRLPRIERFVARNPAGSRDHTESEHFR